MKKKKQSKTMTQADSTKIGKDLGVAARKGIKTIDALVDLIVLRSGDTILHNDEFGDHHRIKLFKNKDPKKGGYDLRFCSSAGNKITTRLNQVKLAIAKAQAQGWPAYLHKPLSTPESDTSVVYLICLPWPDIKTTTRQQWQRECLITAIKKRGKGKTHFSVPIKSFTFFDQSIINEVFAHFNYRWSIAVGVKRYQFTKKK